MRPLLKTIVLFSITSLASHTQAGSLISQTTISLDFSLQVAKAGIDSCLKNGYSTSVAILDKNGTLKAQLTADGAFLHSAEVSRKKAYTSLSRQLPSHLVENHIKQNNDYNAAMNFNMAGMSTWGGGMPIVFNEEVVGAIGISGAPGGPKDVECAEAALEIANELLEKDA